MKNLYSALLLASISISLFSCKKNNDVPIAPSNVNLKDGLVAWYKFDGNLADSSGHGNHAANIPDGGTIAYTSDKAGSASSAVLMDGINDIIIADDKGSLVTPNSVTISAYYKTSSFATQNLVCKRNLYTATAPAEYGGLAWSINALTGGEPHFAVISPLGADCSTPRGIEPAFDIVYGMQTLSLNQWYHLVAIFHEGSQRIYINGKLRQATTRNFETMRQCPGGKLVIGGYVDDLPTVFNGAINDLRIYNRVLNSFEIAELAKGY